MARVLVAMSGGVDSSVAAALALEAGHEVEGAYMKNWINEDNVLGDCPWEQDIVDARLVAERLGIPFRVVNLMRDYRERVVDYLLIGYRDGLTPNPDVMCNREMKFGVFLQYALDHDFDHVATGHYARRRDNADSSADVLCGRDPEKNQAYFLALLRQEQVQHALFPIGELRKKEVRAEAARRHLPTAGKKDSQGICFIGNVKMRDFLKAYMEDRPGDIVDVEGNVLGRHRGLHLYTLGQKRGVGVASPHYREAYVVVEKRGETNELVLAVERPETPKLWARLALVGSLSFINQPVTSSRVLQAQPRYRAPRVEARFDPGNELNAWIEFSEPQRALTPGQICAFYDGDVLLGGGVFEQIEAE